jgi:putative FmdB family regulatory protein
MPIYEYRCSACGHHLEALQKMSDSPMRKCPECGKSQLKRLVSAPQFRLKGSGWYETDFKNKNETKRNLVERGGAESSEAASDKSTDTAAKEEAGKAVAAAKSGDAAEKPAKAKPAPTKPAAAARKSTSKRRAKTARR